MRTHSCIVMLTFLVLFSACKKDTESVTQSAVPTGSLTLNLTHKIDNGSLTYDTIKYQNAAGNKFSVTRLFYYISGVKLYKADDTYSIVQQANYVDASNANSTFTLTNVPTGSYTNISFYIGIDTVHNLTGTLPETMENINMAWPPEMGGGYHFMKLEGHYLDGNNVERGYTMHLGTSAALVSHNKLPVSLTINANQTSSLNLQMDINEWFTHPYNYNFNTDGNYTRGNVPLMQLISNNGKDVFTIN